MILEIKVSRGLIDHLVLKTEMSLGIEIMKLRMAIPIPDICLLFSPQAQFLVQFFSTQKRVNHDKTDFATKQRKLRQNSVMWRNFSTERICSTFLIANVEKSVMWRNAST